MTDKERDGGHTIRFKKPIYISGKASIVGRNEGEGPLGGFFDQVIGDATWGESSFEKCEKKLFREAAAMAVSSAGVEPDILLGGDLLNQIVSAGYSARDLGLPFLGLYGACSTMSESMIVGSMAISGGFAKSVVCAASSHYATSERQFRFPLELGTPKSPHAQNTVIGAGSVVLSAEPRMENEPVITAATIGRVSDPGVSEADNMGAAMAPAAVDTVISHLENMGESPEDYDAIITGDLGTLGSELFVDMCKKLGVDVSRVHMDCGSMIFKGMKDEYCGGSGCGCSAVTLAGYFLKEMLMGKYKKVLFTATGALLSPTVVQQGESIPGIAHAVVIERGK